MAALVEAGAQRVEERELTQKPIPGMPSIGFSHVTLLEVEGERDGADELLARLDEWQRSSALHPNHSIIGVDAFAAHGRWTERPDPSSELSGHIVAYVGCTEHARLAEWDCWLDEVHVPDMLDSGAFAAATRWARSEPQRFGANHLTLYDVADRPVEDAVALSADALRKCVAAGRKLSCHVGGMVLTLRPSAPEPPD